MIRKIRYRTLVSALIFSASTQLALASDLSYDFLELRFVDAEFGNVDGDGLQIAGSYNINENWLLIGGFSSLDLDFGLDLTMLEAGGGYVWPQNDQFDLFATGSIVRVDVDAGGGSADETGFRLVGGMRNWFTPQLEGRAELNYLDVDDSDTYIELGGDYHFSPNFAAGVTIDLGGDADAVTIGARWFFGDRRVR